MRCDARVAVAVAGMVWVTACSKAGPAGHDAGNVVAAPRRQPGGASVGGRVISTVDGEPITIEEVEMVVRETGLTPLQALRRLQEERVLAAHAEAAGHASAPEIEDAARRAAVQAMIAARIEAEITPASIAHDEVVARLAEERARFRRPERRRTSHLLARVARGAPAEAWAAAERFTQHAIERLRNAADPIEEARAIAGEQAEGRSFGVLFEELPAVGRGEGLAEAYVDAMFAPSEPGVIERPVRTEFGWHAIILQEIAPAWEAPREEAEATIRTELAWEHRARRLDELVDEALERFPVQVYEDVVRNLLTLDLGSGRGRRSVPSSAPQHSAAGAKAIP